MSSSKIYYDHRDLRGKLFPILTNGCFDVLHVGHLRFLEQAASKRGSGQYFIVAVNDDGSVNRLKGDGRPVNICLDRMELLAGFECVDFVVPFSGDNVALVIRDLRPAMWVKGAPYSKATLNQEEVRAAEEINCHIMILEKFGDYSTTGILERLKA